MNRRRFVVAGISAAVIAACASTAKRLVPPSLVQDGRIVLPDGSRAFVLKVQYVTTTFANGVKLRGRTYNGATVGPAWTVQPGDMLNVRMINQLAPNPQTKHLAHEMVPQPENMMQAMDPDFHGEYRPAAAVNAMNNPHDFNTTNLHVHGIQTLPHLFEPLGRAIRRPR